MTFAVRYTYVDDPALLDEHRPEHRAFLADLAEEGVLLVSGPLGADGPAGALLVLRGSSSEEVRERLTADPFQRRGLVERVEVRAWTPVLGPWSAVVG